MPRQDISTAVVNPDAPRIHPYAPPGDVEIPKLRPFSEAERPPLPLELAIPDELAELRDYIKAVAEALQVSVEAVAPLAMGISSLAAARTFEVEPFAGWREPAPLWVVVLADPGERKSALLKFLTEPLRQWQEDERSLLNRELAAYAEMRSTLEARLKGIRKKIERAKPDDIETYEAEARSLAQKLAAKPVLDAPDLLTTNATPEAARDLLVRNGEKVGLVSPETDAEQLLGKRYQEGQGPNINLYLAAHAGDSAPTHRVGRDIPLERPALAMVLCVQPEALHSVLRDPAAVGRGLTARMLLVRPISRMGSRTLHPPPVPDNLSAAWKERLRRILDIHWPGRVIVNEHGPERSTSASRVLTLSLAASEALTALRAAIESRLGDVGDLRPISGFASKLPGAIARLALSLQVLQNPSAREIDGPSMRSACAWAPFLIEHFKAAVGIAAEPPAVRHARRLAAALRRHPREIITAREAFRLIDATGMQKMADFEPVADILVERGFLIPLPAEMDSRGRPSTRFRVNPAAIGET